MIFSDDHHPPNAVRDDEERTAEKSSRFRTRGSRLSPIGILLTGIPYRPVLDRTFRRGSADR